MRRAPPHRGFLAIPGYSDTVIRTRKARVGNVNPGRGGAFMSFDLTPTGAQHDLARRTHEFSESVIRPVAADYGSRQVFPWPVLEEAAERGFYCPLFYRDLIGGPSGLS